MATTTDVAKNGDLPASFVQLRNMLHNSAEVDNNIGGRDATLNMIDRIMRAETPEDVFAEAERGPTKAENVIGIPFEFIGARPLKSAEKFVKDSKEKDGQIHLDIYFAIAVINLLTGEEDVITCGGEFVAAQMGAIMRMENGFPCRGAFMMVQTSAGYDLPKIRNLSETEKRAVK